MRAWIQTLSFGRIAFGAWSLYAMFMLACWGFTFDKVVGALGGLADRLGWDRPAVVQPLLERSVGRNESGG